MRPRHVTGTVYQARGAGFELRNRDTQYRAVFNPTLIRILELCDGTLSRLEIAARIQNEYTNSIALEVEEGLQELVRLGLVRLSHEAGDERHTVHLIRVAYLGFPVDSERLDNFFLDALLSCFTVRVVDDPRESDLAFVYCSTADDAAGSTVPECVAVQIADSGVEPDFERYEFIFSESRVSFVEMERHVRLPEGSVSGLLGPSGKRTRMLAQTLDTRRIGDKLYSHLMDPGQDLELVRHPDTTPLLTVGMATYDDFDGVYFTIQGIRLQHCESMPDVEFVILDNNPDSPAGKAVREFAHTLPNIHYRPYTSVTGTAVRNVVFEIARTPWVLCVDSHVMLMPHALSRLVDYIRTHPRSRDLLQGPLVSDDLQGLSAFFEPTWQNGMYGRWARDERAEDLDGEPFEIRMQGLGLFACRTEAWPGFNADFRGFGGEEGYIHEKVRRQGGKVLCLPFLRWIHRFIRPDGAIYPNYWEDRIRNYLIGHLELQQDTYEVERHFMEVTSREMVSRVKANLRFERQLQTGSFSGKASIPSVRISGNRISVYQIAYDPASAADIGIDCIPIVAEKTDRYLENRVILQLARSEEIEALDYVGIFSWKFFQKIPLSLYELLQRCKLDSFSHELYSFFGLVGEAPIWHTAEAKHPGIMNAAALLFDKLGMRVDVRELIAPAIYQNHFLCRPQLLRSYCDGLLAPAIELMEADEELNRALSVNAHYQVQNLDDSEMRKIFGQSSATLHPFVCERLLSTWLSINRCTDKVKQIWDGRFVEPGRQYADSEHHFGLPAKDLRTYGQKDHAYDAAIVVTTHGEEVWYTQRCLQRIAEWKTPRQQVVVVYHDASPLLRSYLEFLAFEGVIDVLLRAEPSHGHVRGVNLGVWHSDAPYVFHISIDVTVGPGIVDECIRRMEGNPELGAVGWHYQWGSREQGSHWIGDDLVYTVRPQDKDMDCRDGDELSLEYSAAVEQAPWFTGRVFSRIGKKRLLFFNGSFFGVRRALWDVLGGFDESRFSHYWAEDLLCYGILDQGYGIGNLPANLSDGSNPDFFSQTSELKWTGREDPDRNRNELVWASQIGHPGLTVNELVLVDLLLASRPDARVAVTGLSTPPTVYGAEIGGGPGRGREPSPGSYDLVIVGPEGHRSHNGRRDYADMLSSNGVLVHFPQSPTDRPLEQYGRLGLWYADRDTMAFVREQ
ncbi:MAG: glycosyltransferase [Arenicellales bacterium]